MPQASSKLQKQMSGGGNSKKNFSCKKFAEFCGVCFEASSTLCSRPRIGSSL